MLERIGLQNEEVALLGLSNRQYPKISVISVSIKRPIRGPDGRPLRSTNHVHQMVNFVSEMNLTSFKDSFKLIYRRNRGRSAKSTRSKGDSNDFVEKEKSIRPETVLKKMIYDIFRQSKISVSKNYNRST